MIPAAYRHPQVVGFLIFTEFKPESAGFCRQIFNRLHFMKA